MTTPFSIDFGDGRTAAAVRVDQPAQVPAALAALGLHGPRPVIVLTGGAGGLDRDGRDRLRPLFAQGLVPMAEWLGAVVVDGGTDSGVMHLVGRARTGSGATFPLVGVVTAALVSFPGRESTDEDAVPLDAHHTHFVLVPGCDWGAESRWIAQVSAELAGGLPSATVLVHGGEIAYQDLGYSLDAGRVVLVMAGTGRTADELARAVRGGPAGKRAVRLAASGLVRAVDAGDPANLARTLGAVLGGRETSRPPG
jgi:hypothetical protein